MGARTKRSPAPASRKKAAKRSNHRGPKPPRPERVARILVDADLHGDAYAATTHGVSERTVIRYRQGYADDSVVAELVTELTTRLTTGWEQQLRAVQKELTLLVLQGARSPEASLRDRTDALRRVSELGISKHLLGPDDDERTEHHQRRDPQSPRGPGAGAEAAREGRGPQEGGGRGRGEDEED